LPTLDIVRRIAGAKSGEFFALACHAGALLSDAGLSDIATCTDFGYNLGILIQISDDFRAIWAPSRRGDLITAHRTFPIAYALSVADPDMRQQIRNWLAQAPDDRRALHELQILLADLGALHHTVLEAGLYHGRAREALLKLSRPNQAQYALLTLLDTVFPAVAMDQWSSPFTTSSIDSSDGPAT
jgi:geranylgeranyl pyrophosphate synthase